MSEAMDMCTDKRVKAADAMAFVLSLDLHTAPGIRMFSSEINRMKPLWKEQGLI